MFILRRYQPLLASDFQLRILCVNDFHPNYNKIKKSINSQAESGIANDISICLLNKHGCRGLSYLLELVAGQRVVIVPNHDPAPFLFHPTRRYFPHFFFIFLRLLQDFFSQGLIHLLFLLIRLFNGCRLIVAASRCYYRCNIPSISTSIPSLLIQFFFFCFTHSIN